MRPIMQTLPKAMPSVATPDELLAFCKELANKKGTGFLLTGGCTPEAKVPLKKYLASIKQIKNETGLLIAAHTGLVNTKEAKAIKEAGVDSICVDVVGSPETTQEIYGLRITPDQYRETLLALKDAGFKNISPHVCVGLHNGMLKHELAALELIHSTIKPSNLVITGLTNVVGTPLEKTKINPLDYAYIVSIARIMFPRTTISLGCARGKGTIRSEIDRLCAGVTNNIAIPTQTAYKDAQKRGLTINEYKSCCCFLSEDLK
jgi:uncharacterized radical SAM superfamily protein